MNQAAIDAAMLLMEAHINALNKRDAKAIASTLHFPHHRLSGSTWKTWDTSEHYFDDFLIRVGSDWSRSTFSDIKIMDSSINKVHVDAEIRRYDSNDTMLSNFRSLWVIINIKGIWAAKVRSSFAPE